MHIRLNGKYTPWYWLKWLESNSPKGYIKIYTNIILMCLETPLLASCDTTTAVATSEKSGKTNPSEIE